MNSEKVQNQEENKGKKKNEITVTFNKYHLGWAIILVALSPVVVAIGITWPQGTWLSNTTADANSWLQFWGSMLGGFIGTLAVIYVAHLQNAKQEEQLKIQNDQQETLLNKQISENEKQNKKLIEFEISKLKLDILKSGLNDLRIANEAISEIRSSNLNLYHLHQEEIYAKVKKEINFEEDNIKLNRKKFVQSMNSFSTLKFLFNRELKEDIIRSFDYKKTFLYYLVDEKESNEDNFIELKMKEIKDYDKKIMNENIELRVRLEVLVKDMITVEGIKRADF